MRLPGCCVACWIGWLLVVPPIEAVEAWQPQGDRIKTQWADQVTPENCLPDYPRPLMARSRWTSLNGLWDYAITGHTAEQPNTYDGAILVPFAIEAALSGVGRTVAPEQVLWYRRTFTVPSGWRDQRVLLHFGAVDWECTVWVNGHRLGSHQGGYDPFSWDISSVLRSTEEQEVLVRVWDPTNADNAAQARGKQVQKPHGIYYTSVTGIWQTVWIEPVPRTYIRSLKVIPQVDASQALIHADIVGPADAYTVTAVAGQGMQLKHRAEAPAQQKLTLPIKNPKLWSPEDPYLYPLTVTLSERKGQTVDQVTGHLGMRQIALQADSQGRQRLCLNGEPLFHIGPLDQGWWPDGLYTAPSDEALRYDLEVTKRLGFNMLRKHVKIEPQRLYYWCDRMGLLVWQDMPSAQFNRKTLPEHLIQRRDQQFERELQRMIDALYNHPSIVMWIPFNEGWGQYDTERITQWIKTYDPTRLVNSASGWHDRQVGDVRDIHAYPGPSMPGLENDRAAVLGEFGGLGLALPGHTWQSEGNWGYRNLLDRDAYGEGYCDLIKALYQFENRGLAGAVYTQTTDVEIETNGLMTYDRRQIKLDPEQIASLNRGYLPPVLSNQREGFLDQREVTLFSHDPYATIRYTLDGSEPERFATRYRFPFDVNDDITIKARSTWPDGTVSRVMSHRLHRVETCHAAVTLSERQAGLQFDYYRGHWARLPDVSHLTPVTSGVTRRLTLDCVEDRDDFALRFSGYLRVSRRGVYRFYVHSDDGARLRIAESLVVDNDGVHGMQEVPGEIALEAGWHALELLYFQGQGGLGLQVSYEGPRMERQPLPASILGYGTP